MSITSSQIVDDPGGGARFVRVDYTAHAGEVIRRTLMVIRSAAASALELNKVIRFKVRDKAVKP